MNTKSISRFYGGVIDIGTVLFDAFININIIKWCPNYLMFELFYFQVISWPSLLKNERTGILLW